MKNIFKQILNCQKYFPLKEMLDQKYSAIFPKFLKNGQNIYMQINNILKVIDFIKKFYKVAGNFFSLKKCRLKKRISIS